MQNGSLIIKDWTSGVGASPHLGLGLMRNVDIEAFPGAVKVGRQPTAMFITSFAVVFTADAATDIITFASGTVPKTGSAVTVSNSGGALPTGLSAATVYFIIKLSSTTAQLATTLANSRAGTAINITGNGTGTQTITSVDPGTITHMVYEPNYKNTWYLGSNGRVWVSWASDATSSYAGLGAYLFPGNTLTDASGNGLAIFTVSDNSAVYLFVFRDAIIDVFGDVGSGIDIATWTNAWKTLNALGGDARSHHAILGSDNIIYFCDARWVGSIKENSGSVFAPGTAGTYTYNNQALKLPPREIAQCLEELGVNLLTGGNIYNRIYPWDRTSPSFTLPINVPEVSVKKMKNIGGQVYILAGRKGNVYRTQGTYANLFKKLPDAMVNNSSTLQSTIVTWGGIEALHGSHRGGAGVLTTGNSGVYRIYDNGATILDNVPSTGSTNPTSLLVTVDEYYFMGYNGGADIIGTTRYASFQTVLQSSLYRVARKTTKTKYSSLEVEIADPASTGNIRVSYRTDTTSAFTTITTFAADGVVTSFDFDCGLIDIENIQVQVEMDGNIQLMELRLIP